MAFVTGTANTAAELITAIKNACTANGWSVAGNVLFKSTCYVEIKIAGVSIAIQGGRGIDVSNNLTGRANTQAGYLALSTDVPFTFPCTYFIHIFANPDEVYVVANYSVIYYESIGFGVSQYPGLVGTGNWYCGCQPNGNSSLFSVNAQGEGYSGTGPGHSIFTAMRGLPCGVDHSLDGVSWSTSNGSYDWGFIGSRQPNAWNSEAILVPIRVYAGRPSGFTSPVLECVNARYISAKNVNDQDVIVLGSDKWKIYPWHVRGSGFAVSVPAIAVRYDGP